MKYDTGGRVVHLSRAASLDIGLIQDRLAKVIAVFNAIEVGELLCALPDCEVAQRQHCTAMSLLALAEIEILKLSADLTKERAER